MSGLLQCDGTAVVLGVINRVPARLQHLFPVPHRSLECGSLSRTSCFRLCQRGSSAARHQAKAMCLPHAVHLLFKASRLLQEISKVMDISTVRPGNTEGTCWLL